MFTSIRYIPRQFLKEEYVPKLYILEYSYGIIRHMNLLNTFLDSSPRETSLALDLVPFGIIRIVTAIKLYSGSVIQVPKWNKYKNKRFFYRGVSPEAVFKFKCARREVNRSKCI
jgi:hypothetical protein